MVRSIHILLICLVPCAIFLIHLHNNTSLDKCSGKGTFETKPCDYAAIQFVLQHIQRPNFNKALALRDPQKTDYSQEGIMKEIISLYFSKKMNGFFFEAGALDGERFSNTLILEMKQNWTGILVEASTDNYLKLQQKNRKAFLLKACIGDNRGIINRTLRYWREMSMLTDNKNAGVPKKNNMAFKTEEVSCISIRAILEALNVTHIDYLSLDIEGAEIPVLFSFPWSSITVDVVEVEVRRALQDFDPMPKEFSSDIVNQAFFPMFFEKLGYHLAMVKGRDHVYVRRDALF